MVERNPTVKEIFQMRAFWLFLWRMTVLAFLIAILVEINIIEHLYLA